MAQYLEGYEGRLVRALKSLLGSNLIDATTEVGGRALPFRELLATFIRELKRRAEVAAGRPFDCAVFGTDLRCWEQFRLPRMVAADDRVDFLWKCYGWERLTPRAAP